LRLREPRGAEFVKWLALAAALAVLAACGSVDLEPTQAQLKAAWEARNVPPANYKADIVAYMRTYLNDPSNVRNAGVSVPARKTIPGDPGERIVSCVRYSAKKSSGQYGATRTGVAVFASGKLDRFLDTPVIARDVCKDIQLEPFPELQRMTR
jgi:hypothetical protein